MQCGVACLAAVCCYYGKSYSLSSLENYCTPTAEGVSMKAIIDAAKELGFDAQGALVALPSLRNAHLPAILHWNQNHFVVLYKVSRDGRKYYVSDPGKGKICYTEDEFCSHWQSGNTTAERRGVALFLEPTEVFYDRELTNSSEKRSFRFLFSYLRAYRSSFIKIALTLLLGCVLQLVMPFLTQAIVDVGIRDKDIGFVWLILMGELAIVAARTISDFARRWWLLNISMRINISLVSDFFIKLLRLPMAFFDSKLMGDLLQRIGDHSRVQNFLTGQVLNIAFTLLSLIVFGAVLFIYNTLIFTVFVVGSIAYGVWITVFLHRRKVLDYEMFELQAINQNRTYQLVTTMQEIKLQDCEERRRLEWEETQTDLLALQTKSLRLSQAQEAGSIFINEVKNILITVFAATAVINGEITLGTMLAIQYIVGQLNSPISQIMSFAYTVQDVQISLERINEIHERRNEEDGGKRLQRFNSSKMISIKNVCFKYDRHALNNTLENISFEIPEGKLTAIVGASGSGKSTLIKLLLGYYPVASGAISIGGHNIDEYELKWWRRQCGVVMQEGVIFSESIARNIAVADGEMDMERIEHAARIANIHDCVMALPLKYDTKIGRDGVGLSQGQKQRILIARAVYKNPEFIFLDEATNSLDASNEREIVSKLNDFYQGKTVVVVAHRLSTVKNADRIVVLDGGRVVEVGTHESLSRAQGAYYNLIRNQLELGQ